MLDDVLNVTQEYLKRFIFLFNKKINIEKR